MLQLADAGSAGRLLAVAVTNTVTLAADVAGVVGKSAAAVDALHLADAADRAGQAFARTGADMLAFADSAGVGGNVLARAIADVLAATDQIVAGRQESVSVADVLFLVDTAAGLVVVPGVIVAGDHFVSQAGPYGSVRAVVPAGSVRMTTSASNAVRRSS
jgi:hypothetical protein